MASVQSKTLAPLLILRILEEYSDEKHPLTREEIERLLDEKYGITMERKSFFRHMENLINFLQLDEDGEHIVRTTVKVKRPEEISYAGFYVNDRTLNEQELRIIIDALSGSPYVSQWETEDLVRRLAGLGGRLFRKKMEAYQFIGQGSKVDKGKLTISFALEIIDEAITNHKQIRFDRMRTGSDGKKELSDCYNIICTPIRYFVREHNYYLVGIHEVKGVLQPVSYPISSIANIEILNVPAQDIRSIPEFRYGVDWQKFFREHPVMSWLNGKPELCTFLCFRWQIDDIKRRFGDALRIRQLSDEEYEAAGKAIAAKLEKEELVEVEVITDPYAAAEFSRSFALGMWLISPKDARGAVRFYLRSQLEHRERLEQHYIKEENRLQTKVTTHTSMRSEDDTD